MYTKLTFAAELKVVLEPEFLSPADNRPQIRDVAMLLCTSGAAENTDDGTRMRDDVRQLRAQPLFGMALNGHQKSLYFT